MEEGRGHEVFLVGNIKRNKLKVGEMKQGIWKYRVGLAGIFCLI